ncbi:beta-lactamase family protein [Streptomonospora sp. PA3]|uniref:serine hydrolase domain-containing protein n=1 Tax=Streptomonospora sp. PA3 TaxID=2607326 RepID=UPI0012DED915|nr:serine hydrolase domain-containing protein [Streptomonospora sp. PA3]MUL41502.1 beta-lactamase family protein [Streptomonospora sp. PA3]
MTTRRRFIAQAVALLPGAAAAAAAAPLTGCSAPADGSAASIGDFLEDAVPDGTGLTVLAVRRGAMVYCRGTGLADRESGIGAGSGTVYDIGSITKQFTAAAVLRLEEDGALSTGDPLRAFVDGLPAEKRGITLHQLLTHTAGLVDTLGGDYAPLGREEMLEAVARSELRSDPGAKYHYSNAGYSVLAAVIEKATGAGFEEYLAESLFAPAQMERTGYVLPRWDPLQIAVEYDSDGAAQGRPNDRPWAVDGPYWNLRGNGGLLSTATDMYRWHRALASGAVLTRAAKRKLFAPHVPEGGGSYYGYGWVVEGGDGRTTVWHNGGNGRSYAEFSRHLDDDLAVFWASNRATAAGEWDVAELGLTQAVTERLRAAS